MASVDFPQWLSAIPGVAALGGAAFGFGVLRQRVRNLEEDVRDVPALRENLGRIDERTQNLVKTTEKMDGKLDTIISNMLTDARTVLTRTTSRPSTERGQTRRD